MRCNVQCNVRSGEMSEVQSAKWVDMSEVQSAKWVERSEMRMGMVLCRRVCCDPPLVVRSAAELALKVGGCGECECGMKA